MSVASVCARGINFYLARFHGLAQSGSDQLGMIGINEELTNAPRQVLLLLLLDSEVTGIPPTMPIRESPLDISMHLENMTEGCNARPTSCGA